MVVQDGKQQQLVRFRGRGDAGVFGQVVAARFNLEVQEKLEDVDPQMEAQLISLVGPRDSHVSVFCKKAVPYLRDMLS